MRARTGPDLRRPEEVLVFVRRGDDFLVLRRSERQGGYWHSVAGALEPGESYAQAATRELLEETGLAADPSDLGRPYSYSLEGEEWRLWDLPPGTERILVECFVVHAPDEWEPTLDWEHDEHRWCPRDEAAALLFWPEVGDLLREIG